MTTETLSTTSRAMKLKLPDFWENNPELWFINVEAQLFMAGIPKTDPMAYAHIVAKLLTHVIDLVQGSDDQRTYKEIKARLIERFGESKATKMTKLTSMELGDKKPSHLLAEMQQLGTSIGMDESMLRSLYLKALPGSLSQTLSIIPNPLAELGNLADVMLAHTPQTTVSQVSVGKELGEQIETLAAAIRKIKFDSSNKRSDNSNRPGPSVSDLCWYHEQFGDKARRCRSPCKYNQKN